MNEAIDNAYHVSSQLFGPESGIPWWGWLFVVIALFWKFAVPDPKVAKRAAEERDDEMLAAIYGLSDESGGKKGKKGKK